MSDVAPISHFANTPVAGFPTISDDAVLPEQAGPDAETLARTGATFLAGLSATPQTSNPLFGRRILIVDNQECILRTVRPFLESWGMVVEQTTSSKEALQKIRTEPFDFLITDLIMPEMDGITLINQLIESGHLPPTLILSGSQGKRQAALTFHELASRTFREAGLPLSYMIKSADHFGEGLQDRLLQLANLPSLMVNGGAKQKTAMLTSLFAEEPLTVPGKKNPQRQKLIEAAVDSFVDARFSYFVRFNPVMARLQQVDQTIPEGRLKEKIYYLISAWFECPNPSRLELMQFDRVQWHDYYGSICYIKIGCDWLGRDLSDAFGADLKQAIEETDHLFELMDNIRDLQKMGDSKYASEVFTTLKSLLKDDKRFNHRLFLDIADSGSLNLVLPESFLRQVTTQLVANARNFTALGTPDPLLRALIVDADPGITTPPMGEHQANGKYFYLGVSNHGSEIPADVRERMLGATAFTTREMGSGLGLTVVKEYLREVGGWLAVESRDGKTEVGVYIPIDKNKPPEYPQAAGSTSAAMATPVIVAPTPNIPSSGKEAKASSGFRAGRTSAALALEVVSQASVPLMLRSRTHAATQHLIGTRIFGSGLAGTGFAGALRFNNGIRNVWR